MVEKLWEGVSVGGSTRMTCMKKRRLVLMVVMAWGVIEVREKKA
jgi:hypothetical protein